MTPESEDHPAFGGGDSNDSNEEKEASDQGREELSLLRSGSAPPTIEGSLSAGFLDGDDRLRLPESLGIGDGEKMYESGGGGGAMPPGFGGLKEEKVMQHGKWGGGGAMPPGFGGLKEEKVMQHGKWGGGDEQTGFPEFGDFGDWYKQRSITNMDGVRYQRPVSGNPSLPDSQAFREAEHIARRHEWAQLSALNSGTNMQNISSPTSPNYASVMGASPRNYTPDLVRSLSPRIANHSGDTMSLLNQRYVNMQDSYDENSSEIVPSGDITTYLSDLSLSSPGTLRDARKFQIPLMQDKVDAQNMQRNEVHKQHLYLNDNLKAPSMPTLNRRGSSPSQYLKTASPTFSMSNFGSGRVSPLVLGNQAGYGNNLHLVENGAPARALGRSGVEARAFGGGLAFESDLFTAEAKRENFARHRNQSTMDTLPRAHMDPSYLQYLRSDGSYSAALDNQQMHREPRGNSSVEFLRDRNPYLEALIQKAQYGLVVSSGFHGNSAFATGYPYHENQVRHPMFLNTPIDRNMEQIMCVPSTVRNMAGNFEEPWPSGFRSKVEESITASLFKENKTDVELSNIAGHVVESSLDQDGSRFIQLKLETASAQEKNMIVLEIIPQALYLTTDVFGNYVIQKVLEHGSASQTRQLAEQLIGHVLTLSLQTYGCRVIQKALEVIELDQQRKIVAELDGHVMHCVNDQNGNHVIQKCIEFVPENAIEFIVTTVYDQAIALCTHPYGCRVIQRVLEHCNSTQTQTVVMTKILQSASMLAQDPYGNFVIQHVLEHGKSSERTAIISQLFGKIVEMSMHKFASNVIEKCLSFGTREEHETLVHEMLGSTDENEPLQRMMKNQFANYVVQKVLETCDNSQLELLLNRIKVHFDTLKKYTYGKHVVARVEKLVAAGVNKMPGLLSLTERRIDKMSLRSAKKHGRKEGPCTAN